MKKAGVLAMVKTLKVQKSFSLDKAVLAEQLGLSDDIERVYLDGGACAPDGTLHACFTCTELKTGDRRTSSFLEKKTPHFKKSLTITPVRKAQVS